MSYWPGLGVGLGEGFLCLDFYLPTPHSPHSTPHSEGVAAYARKAEGLST